MIRVGVVGATGYTGAELIRIIANHPKVELSAITSRQYAGRKFSDIYPSMTGIIDRVCEKLSMNDSNDFNNFCKKVDFVFLALPHKISMKFAPEFIDRNIKVVDLSADFRFNDVSKYEQHYQPHTAKKLLEKSVYGLCEIYHNKISNADIVGNPGCYPTSILLPLLPLIADNIIQPDSIIADSKSGVSGAGRSLSLGTHFCEVNEAFKAYNIAKHRHIPEIEEILSIEANKEVGIVFAPHLLPISRGMLSTIYAKLSENITTADVENSLKSKYSQKPFIRICSNLPNVSNVQGTNYCDIGFTIDKRKKQLILVSVIDNLVKGAAGQAIQNMNIMLGINETTGLLQTPFTI